jgi:hypothetical protein
MTQILSVVTRKCVFHASDRLLTQTSEVQTTDFDRNSNKTIVFCARDAQVVVGYSGRAYLDNLPTDTFIAQALIGIPLPGTGSIGWPDSWVDIGRAVDRLMEQCTAALQRSPLAEQTPQASGLEISILGWRQGRHCNSRIAPIVWAIQRPKTGDWGELEVKRHTRLWEWNRGFALSCIPEAPREVIDWVRANLRERAARSPLEIKRILIEGVRRCAEARPATVGKDCQHVLLTPTMKPQVLIDYVQSEDPEFSKTPASDHDRYSPWIVAPPMAWAPTRLSAGAGWENMQSGFAWRVEGEQPPDAPKRYAYSPQPRPPDPQAGP